MTLFDDFRPSMPFVRACLLGTAATLAACSADVKGPTPNVDPPSAEASPPPVDPEIVCRDQLTTTVTLHGEDFSPVPIDIPDAPKLSLPDVVLTRSHALDGAEVSDPDVTLWSGDPDADPTNAYDADGEPLVEWKSRQEMSFTVNQDLILGELAEGQELPAEGEDDPRDRGVLAEGVWDVRVENANGELIESLQSLAVVKKPEVAELTPGITCLDQGSRTITLDGQRFLRNEGDEALLEVEGVDTPFEMSLSECTDIDHAGLDAEVCDRVEVELAEGSIDTGFPGLVVQNPETAACNSEEDIKLRVVPPPSIDRVAPPMACVAEGERTFTIDGQDFLRIDGGDPLVTIGGMDFDVDAMGGCEPLDTQGHDVERCSSIDITIAQDQFDPDLYEVTVQNPDPAGCDNTATGALRIVPPPTVDDIQPELVCVDDSSRTVTISGSDFLVVDGEKPAVDVDGMALDPDAVEPGGCADLEVDGLSVQQCDSLDVTFAQAGVGVGMPDIEVTNPGPAGCSDARSDQLTVVAGPSIDSVDPVLVCTVDGDKMVEITGTGFLDVDGTLPVVNVAGSAVTVTGLSGCADVDTDTLAVRACDTITVTLAMDSLSEGAPGVEVINPDPAGCSASQDEILLVPAAPMIAMLEPLNVCEGTTGDVDLTLTGSGILRVGSSDASLTFDGAAATATVSGCGDAIGTSAAGDDVFDCTTVDTTVTLTANQTMTGGTSIPLVLTNDHVPACSLSAMTALNVVAPPSVTSVDIPDTAEDTQICSDEALTFTINGTGFVEGATVTLSNDNETITADSVTVVDDMEITATFDDGLPFDDDPTFDLQVANAGQCESDLIADVFEVNPTPLVFFVDPPVVYNGRPIDITVFSSGLSAQSVLDRIELVDSGDNVTILCDTVAGGDNPDCQSIRANRNVATVDAGFTAGDYALRVTSNLGCTGELPGGLGITDNLALTVTSVEPNYVSQSESTAVVIDGTGFSTTGGLPRVYLSPFTTGDTAQALRAVEFQSSTRLTGVVPAGLAIEDYDVIVVNATGEVGLLAGDDPAAIHVTGNEPPIVTSITPSTIDESPEQLTLSGDHFDNTGDALTVDFVCEGTGGTEMASGTVNTVTETQIDLTLTHALSNDLICQVTVTNADGATFTYSSISTKNSSGNLATFVTSDATMNEPRRALGLMAARPTATSRYLYAVGGDDGTFMGAKDTVEAVRVGVDGALVGEWSYQRPQGTLPEPRTNMGFARVDQFLYVTGGHDGTVDTGMGETNGATDTVYRAQVLDPLAGPEVGDLDAVLGADDGSTGLEGGLWQYRIAATFPGDDPSNPGGEGMAGEVLNVQLPDLSAQGDARKILLTLAWDEVAGADGYRIYRSPSTVDPSMDAVSELLFELDCSTPATPNLANCTCEPTLTCVDDGSATTDDTQTPLPPGSLGMWHEVLPLVTAREGHVTRALRHPNPAKTVFIDDDDPANDYETWVLYACGGRDNGDPINFLDDYEWVEIRVYGDGRQELQDTGGGTWDVGDLSIGTGRADLLGWALTPTDSSFIPSDTAYLALASGFTDASNSTISEASAGYLAATSPDGNLSSGTVGALDDWNSGSISRGGSCFGDASGRLYVFGGENSSGSPQGDRAGVLQSGPGTGNNWSAGGGGVLDPARSYCAAAQESSFFFIAGGVGDPDGMGIVPLDTIQTTVE